MCIYTLLFVPLFAGYVACICISIANYAVYLTAFGKILPPTHSFCMARFLPRYVSRVWTTTVRLPSYFLKIKSTLAIRTKLFPDTILQYIKLQRYRPSLPWLLSTMVTAAIPATILQNEI